MLIHVSVLAGAQLDRIFPLPGKTGLSDSLRKDFAKKTAVVFDIKVNARDIKTAQFFSTLDDRSNRLFTAMMNVSSKQLPRKSPHPAPEIMAASDKIECIVQQCSEKLTKSFGELFPAGIPAKNLSAIIVSHSTENDMSLWSAEMDAEREQLTEQFIQTAIEIVQALKENGVWADFIDPSSGRPYYSPYTNATFFDMDERYKEFGFAIQDLGCCKCLEHPVWGVKAFVGCILTTASPNHPILKEIIQGKVE
jgi:hypothetical protein